MQEPDFYQSVFANLLCFSCPLSKPDRLGSKKPIWQDPNRQKRMRRDLNKCAPLKILKNCIFRAKV